MAFDQAGEGGLRRRLHMAVEGLSDYSEVAAILGISVQVLTDYLTDPAYIMGSSDYGQVLSNLANLPLRWHERASTQNWLITFWEKPQWTASDVANFVPPEAATQVVEFVYAGNYDEEIQAAGPDDLDIFSVQQMVEAATHNNLDNLITIVTYEPQIEYPAP